MWNIDLARRTAQANGFIVNFRERQMKGDLISDCFCDSNGVIWQATVAPASTYISNEAQRMRLIYEAVDAYRLAARAAVDPFPPD